jgi:hypothetical protein
MARGQLLQSGIERQQLIAVVESLRNLDAININSHLSATMTHGTAASRMIDEDMAHRLAGCSDKMR